MTQRRYYIQFQDDVYEVYLRDQVIVKIIHIYEGSHVVHECQLTDLPEPVQQIILESITHETNEN